MKIIIAGSRTFNDYQYLSEQLDLFCKDKEDIEIVSGMARGADILGYRYAKEHNLKVSSFPADWDVYGKSAGYIRNMQMGDYADYLIAFWDGKSKGTEHMINYMKRINKHGRVYNI